MMSTRCSSHLVIGIAALAFIAVLLFSERITSAGKGNAPTAPTNLVVTAITTTSVSLSWGPSSSNSGKFSYRVRINNLYNSYNMTASVSQSQTTYTAMSLSANTPYSFAVYAIDDRGNRSADSNVVGATTKPDTTPPTTPVLEATVVAPSQVQLTWTASTDDIPNNCCSYSVNINGSTYTGHLNWVPASTGKLSAIIRHLTPGTTYTFAVNAADYSGSVATSNGVTRTTDPSNDVTPPSVPTNLYLVRYDSCEELWLGWNKSTDETDSQDKIEYEIYVNGVLSPLPVAVGIDVDFVYGDPSGQSTFTLKAVDRSGNTSAASSPLFLRPCG